jgi:TRAP-type C4-dicarboxylate transport system permease small subunit
LVRKTASLIDHLINGYSLLAMIAAGVLAAITLVSVFWRYALNNPIFGIQDISALTLTVFVSGAIIFAAREGSHLTVDLLPNSGGRATRAAWRIVAAILSAAAALLVGIAAFAAALCGADCGMITANLGISYSPFYLIIALAFFTYSMFEFINIIFLENNTDADSR